MLIWTLIVLGVLILVARSVFGQRVALLLIALWLVIGVGGYLTGIGIRR